MHLTCITITQSTIITSPIGFNTSTLGWNNVVSTLYQRCATLFRRCVTLFRRCFNVGHWRCINVVQRWKSDVGFCFIFNVGSMLFQHWSRTLKQRRSDVEMLTGKIYIRVNLKQLSDLTYTTNNLELVEDLDSKVKEIFCEDMPRGSEWTNRN